MDGTCTRHLADLLAGRHTTTGDELDAGAQLLVTDPDGREVFRAALARHHRIDPDDPHTLWIRPILGGGHASEPSRDPASGRSAGRYVFNLNVARRRALTFADVRTEPDGDVVFQLRNSQTARIQPVTGTELDELRRWDEFTLNVLTASEEASLEALDGDSWQGRFA